MKKPVLFVAMTMVCLGLFALDVETVIAKLDSAGRKTMVGKDVECGAYIICREEVSVRGDVNVAREQAKLNARQTIAEVFSVKVSATSTRTLTTKESVRGEDESFEQVEFAQSVARKDIGQVQRGISVCKESVAGAKLTVYCLLTEQVVDATADLEKAMKKLGPDTVRATGVGYYGVSIPVSKAHEVALAEAQRNAIAGVMGMSMASTSAKQSVSSESVDNDGTEAFACDDTFKCKTFSACAGFVESSRIVDEQKTDSAVFVTIVAKVARDKLMDDYRSYLESMGNPGFCVRSNDSSMIAAYSGFFAGLGLRMVGNVYEAAYVVDVIGNVEGEEAVVTVAVRDKTAGSTLFSVSGTVEAKTSATAAFAKALDGMRGRLHQELDRFIARANADGRKITVRLGNYDDGYRHVAKVVKAGLEMVPGAKNVRQNRSAGSGTAEFTLNYVGDTEDLAEFLAKHMATDVKRRAQRPKLGKVQNTLVEFDFE
ncbi:MAG: hypothetical protein ACI4RD_00940 [Kiritimatiellia bacterium]